MRKFTKATKIWAIIFLGVFITDITFISLNFGYKAYLPQFQYYEAAYPMYNRPIPLLYGHAYNGELKLNSTGVGEVDLVVNVTISVNGTVVASKNVDRHEGAYDIEDDEPEVGDMTEYLYFTYTPQTANEMLVITLTGYQYDAWTIKIYADLPINLVKYQETFRITSIVLFFVTIAVVVCCYVSAEIKSEIDTDAKN